MNAASTSSCIACLDLAANGGHCPGVREYKNCQWVLVAEQPRPCFTPIPTVPGSMGLDGCAVAESASFLAAVGDGAPGTREPGAPHRPQDGPQIAQILTERQEAASSSTLWKSAKSADDSPAVSSLLDIAFSVMRRN